MKKPSTFLVRGPRRAETARFWASMGEAERRRYAADCRELDCRGYSASWIAGTVGGTEADVALAVAFAREAGI